MKETKLCKHCQTEIPKKAKVCPNCRKKQGGKLKWIIIAIVALIAIGSMASGGDEGSKETGKSTSSAKNEEQIKEYVTVSVDDMMKALSENAMSASDTYKNQYLEVTGRLDVIDSSGKYIGLYPENTISIVGVTCYIKGDEQLEAVKSMKTGDIVTLKGKCTTVGEVMGYSLDIEEIVK